MPTPINDYDVTQAMLTYGGSFVEALAKAFRAADARNQARIKEAFADYWQQYADLRRQVMASPLSAEEQAEKDAERRALKGYSDSERERV